MADQNVVERVIDSDFILELYQNYKKMSDADGKEEYLSDIKRMVKLMGRTIEYTPEP